MIGDGPLAAKCQTMVRELDLSKRVRIHGAQVHHVVYRYMQEATLFVQHSVTAANGDAEGLPVSILEAMASGLPIVSTRHAAIPEAVRDNVTGWLVDEYDLDGMATAMADLLDDPARAARFGVAGRELILANYRARKNLRSPALHYGFPANFRRPCPGSLTEQCWIPPTISRMPEGGGGSRMRDI